jgi:phage tail sheath protein FI
MGKKRKRKGRKGAGGGGYQSPGVYVEEVSSGSRPIEGVGTAVAAFVGLAEKGPGTIWRRAGTLLVLVTGAAAGVRAWRHRAGRSTR